MTSRFRHSYPLMDLETGPFFPTSVFQIVPSASFAIQFNLGGDWILLNNYLWQQVIERGVLIATGNPHGTTQCPTSNRIAHSNFIRALAADRYQFFSARQKVEHDPDGRGSAVFILHIALQAAAAYAHRFGQDEFISVVRDHLPQRVVTGYNWLN